MIKYPLYVTLDTNIFDANKLDFSKESTLGIWNDLSTNEQETVMSMLRGLRKKKNSSSICIGCSFFYFLALKR